MYQEQDYISAFKTGDVSSMKNIAVVLVETRYPENIGAAARACANFGVEDLRLVCPSRLDWERMEAMATNIGKSVLGGLKIFDNLEDALSGCSYVVGSTARLGNYRRVYKTLRELAPEVVAYSTSNRIALVFGNEKWGLTNQQLYYCNDVYTIPTEGNTSLNLAQAVVVTLYEIYSRVKDVSLEKPALATFEEQQVMYHYIERVCELVDFVPHNNTVLWMTTIKRMLSRMDLTSKDAKIITGFCRKLLRFASLIKE